MGICRVGYWSLVRWMGYSRVTRLALVLPVIQEQIREGLGIVCVPRLAAGKGGVSTPIRRGSVFSCRSGPHCGKAERGDLLAIAM